jgi:hypothetical protein
VIAVLAAVAIVCSASLVAQVAYAAAASVGPSSKDNINSRVTATVAFPEQWLNIGGSWDFGNAHLIMQSDGNLVIYKKGTTTAKWSSNTSGSGAVKMLFTTGDNLQVQTSSGSIKWQTHTNNLMICQPEETQILALQSDSNLVIYCGFQDFQTNTLINYDDPTWSSHTNGI